MSIRVPQRRIDLTLTEWISPIVVGDPVWRSNRGHQQVESPDRCGSHARPCATDGLARFVRPVSNRPLVTEGIADEHPGLLAGEIGCRLTCGFSRVSLERCKGFTDPLRITMLWDARIAVLPGAFTLCKTRPKAV